jgi:hypothetical protein
MGKPGAGSGAVGTTPDAYRERMARYAQSEPRRTFPDRYARTRVFGKLETGETGELETGIIPGSSLTSWQAIAESGKPVDQLGLIAGTAESANA